MCIQVVVSSINASMVFIHLFFFYMLIISKSSTILPSPLCCLKIISMFLKRFDCYWAAISQDQLLHNWWINHIVVAKYVR